MRLVRRIPFRISEPHNESLIVFTINRFLMWSSHTAVFRNVNFFGSDARSSVSRYDVSTTVMVGT